MSNKRSSNSTPWLSDYVLQQLAQSDGGSRRQSRSSSPPPPPPGPKKLVQILSRGGAFWQSCRVWDDAWLVVTDGEHGIVAYLSVSCRLYLLDQTKTAPPGAMRFLHYARGSLGVLEAYTFRSSPKIALMVQKWIAKPGLQGMIASNSVIQPIHEHIPVRQVMQQQQQQQQQEEEQQQQQPQPQQQEQQEEEDQDQGNQRLVLGNAQEAVDDPRLFDELVRIALDAAQDKSERDDDEKEAKSVEEAVDEGTRTMQRVSRDSVSSDDEDDEDDEDDDEEGDNDHDMKMNLKDMLATQGDEDMSQPSPSRPLRMQQNPATPQRTMDIPARHLILVDASTQTSPLHESLVPAPVPVLQPITREKTIPIKNTTQKRKRIMPPEGAQGTTNNNSLWHRFKEQLDDTNCLMIDVRLPTRPRQLPFRLSRWLHQNLVEEKASLSWMPPRQKVRVSGVPTATFH